MEDINLIADNIVESVLENFIFYPNFENITFYFDTDVMRERIIDHIRNTSIMR